jgi:osmotically-inducible protein OsmY
MRGIAAVSFALAVASGVGALQGCVAVGVGAAVGASALIATDRRSTGAQVDDQSIEVKIATSIGSYGSEVHVNATSYNGIVLLTGEVPNKTVEADVIKVAATTERVKKVDNYLVIGPATEIGHRTNDTYITSKVKARFVESDKFSPTHVKVVTERGVVYLMGIVSRPEGDEAAQLASTTAGVSRVVKLFEYTN